MLLAARFPGVFAEVRGIGLMLGLKCVINNRAVVGKLLEHGLLSIPAGDNVLRLLPPLIIGEQEIEEACGSSMGRARSSWQKPREMTTPRHFLDIDRFDIATLRRIIDLGMSIKRSRKQADLLAGRTLAMIFEKPSTRTRVSFEVGMRQLGRPRRDPGRRGFAARARRDDGGHGASCPDTSMQL